MSIISQEFLKFNGFKLRTINKEKFFINDDYENFEIRLKFTKVGRRYENVSDNIFLKKKGEFINDTTPIIKLCILSKYKDSAYRFNAGLSQINLNQGNFNIAYKENTQNFKTPVLTKDKAKLLCEAIFNSLISKSLMCSNGEPNYSYKIIDCNFEYSDKVVKFYYHYKGYNHDFHMIFKVDDYDDVVSGVSHPEYEFLTVDYFISNFIK